MEETPLTPSTSAPPAARTAQALRELHDRARHTLAAQRERMVQLESQLNRQLDTISDTIAEQLASHGGAATDSQSAIDEIERLQAELEETRRAWAAERDAWQAERAQGLAAGDRAQTLDARECELASGQQTLDQRASELNQLEREQRERAESLAALEAQCAEREWRLAAGTTALEADRANLAEREAACQNEQARLAQDQAEFVTRETQLVGEQATLAADRTALETQQAEIEAQRAACAAEQAELATIQAANAADLIAISNQREALAAAAAATADESAAKLVQAEEQLHTERTAWERERASLEEQRRLLAKERDDLSKALEAAGSELAIARDQAADTTERDQWRERFEQALQDAEQRSARVKELETELASRPATLVDNTAELDELRVERDTLAEQVAALEKKLASGSTSPSTQERADLQRRLELATDDVRDLKRRNAELETKLATASAETAHASVGGNSWEALKRQMLADLEDEGDDVAADRQQERLSIQKTIQTTDDAIARKDREIAELKARLADNAAPVDDAETTLRELVDADEVIAEHRARIAELEAEMQEKLRTAEIELSVERAKIARETVHLEELRSEIESQRSQGQLPAGPGAAQQQPRRRWLSKLGLNGEEGG